MKKTELHLHTCYSLKDAISIPDDLAREAVKLGYTSLGVSEHGSLASVYDHVVACKKHGLKPIIGVEMYEASDRKLSETHFHFLLIAKNRKGYENLMYILADAGKNGFYRKPRTDFSVYSQHAEGVIATSGCLASRIPRMIQRGELVSAKREIEKMQKVFDDYFIEVQVNNVPIQQDVNKQLIRLAKETDTKIVTTCDVHYTKKGDKDVHTAMICNGRGGKLDDDKEYSYDGDTYFLQNYFDISNRLNSQGYSDGEKEEILKGIQNANELADEIEEFSIQSNALIMPSSDEDKEMYREILMEGARSKLVGKPKEYIDRLKYENEVIKSRGYESYFVVVSENVKWAKDNGIEIGPGRGSAAGSLVAWLMGITDIDPIEHGLFFERFLDVTREKFPDIDSDIEDERRDEFLAHLRSKYGEDYVAQISNHTRLKGKSAMKDSLSLHSIPFKEANNLTGSMTDDSLKDPAFLKRLENICGEKTQSVIRIAEGFEGVLKSFGKHAGGVIIGNEPLYKNLPLRYSDGFITEFEKDGVEYVGGVKFDFLGLKMLNIIGRAKREIKRKYGIDIKSELEKRNDPAVYESLANGDTLTVFQLEGSGITSLCKAVKPKKFEEIVAISSLYRPGPLTSGDTWQYAENSRQKKTYEFPIHEKVLGETYDIICFQEQVMQIAHEYAGWNYGFSDKLRKMNEEELEGLRGKFLKDAKVKHGREIMEHANSMWTRVTKNSGYSFNKSHSVAYSDLTYASAYLKHYYPLEWFSACLSRADDEEFVQLIRTMKDRGVNFSTPRIESSIDNFVGDKETNTIFFPITMISGLSEKSVESLKTCDHSSVESFSDTINKRQMNISKIATLFALGSLDIMIGSNSRKEAFIEFCKINKKSPKSYEKYLSLFDLRMFELEKEYLGGYLTAHPLDKYYFKEYESFPLGSEAVIGGRITKVKKHRDKNGNMMCFVTLETQSSNVDLVLFAKTYEKVKGIVKEDAIVMVTGKKTDKSLLVSKIKEVNVC